MLMTDEQKAVLPEKARMHADHALFWLARDDGYSSDRHGLAHARLKDMLYLAGELANSLLARQRDRLALTAIVEQLEKCKYECEAGPLRLNTAFITLKEMADADG